MKLQSIKDEYYILLKSYYEHQQEISLFKAAELGNELVKAEIPTEEIAEIHEYAVNRLGEEYPNISLVEASLRISLPLIEMLMSYGMEFRKQLEYQKRAKEKIETSLKEKETLLREIHHRVKNNMQVISSLLKLQMNATNDKKVKEALLGSQQRVHGMSLIHKILYNTEDLSLINMKNYLLNLVNSISQSYVLNPSKVKIDVYADKINLSIDKATPVGLIVNELISNSLKFGFPDDGAGEITIKLQACGQGAILLTVGDNGIGIPEDYDWQSTDSLGLKLVQILAERQLEGEIELKRECGACFVIKFKQENQYSEA